MPIDSIIYVYQGSWGKQAVFYFALAFSGGYIGNNLTGKWEPGCGTRQRPTIYDDCSWRGCNVGSTCMPVSFMEVNNTEVMKALAREQTCTVASYTDWRLCIGACSLPPVITDTRYSGDELLAQGCSIPAVCMPDEGPDACVPMLIEKFFDKEALNGYTVLGGIAGLSVGCVLSCVLSCILSSIDKCRKTKQADELLDPLTKNVKDGDREAGAITIHPPKEGCCDTTARVLSVCCKSRSLGRELEIPPRDATTCDATSGARHNAIM